MNEHEFEEILKNTVPELPPEDVGPKVTPCRKAINHILIGLTLCTITLNFLALNYILPAVGMVLLLLGFRSLRRENPWFRLCWILTIIRAAHSFFTIILNATIYHTALDASPLGTILMIVNLVSQILLLIGLWRGIAAVQEKAETDSSSRSAAALLIWYSVVPVLAFLQCTGWLVAILMVICFILVIRSLFCISRELEESGYTIRAAAVRISDRALAILLTVILLAGIAFGYIFFSSYTMDWQKEKYTQTAEITAIKEHLLALGYPETALDDLSDEDILLCQNAVYVVVHESDEAVNDGRTVIDTVGNTRNILTVYDTQELHLTNVAVQLGDDALHWRIFHHFLWTVDPGFFGTEALQIWPAYRDSESDWISSGDLTGRVLYDGSDGIYVSLFHSLEEEIYLSDSLLFGRQYSNDIFASFSFPRGSERQRGYVAYGVEGSETSWGLQSQSNYVHQRSMLQYPVETALENRKRSFLNDSSSFMTIQSALQHFLPEDGAE